MLEGQVILVQDPLEVVEGESHLFLNVIGQIEGVKVVGMIVIERRGRGPRHEQDVAAGFDPHAGGVGHEDVVRFFR